jgi:hypothetical protein
MLRITLLILVSSCLAFADLIQVPTQSLFSNGVPFDELDVSIASGGTFSSVNPVGFTGTGAASWQITTVDSRTVDSTGPDQVSFDSLFLNVNPRRSLG